MPDGEVSKGVMDAQSATMSKPLEMLAFAAHGHFTQLCGHWAYLQHIAEHGRTAWQRASGYTMRARAEAAIARWKYMIGDGLRSRADERRATEVDVAVHTLNRMSEFGRPNYVRTA